MLGEKNFEVRRNDRDYQVGDTLALMEFDRERDCYLGGRWPFEVTYILHGSQYGIPEGYCVMALKPLGADPSKFTKPSGDDR
jgi:hypothetical protein